LQRMNLADFIITQTQIQIHAADQENSLTKTYKRWKTFWQVDFIEEFWIGNNLWQQLEYLEVAIAQFVSICRILVIIFDNQVKDIVLTVSRNEASQMRRISIEFVHGSYWLGLWEAFSLWDRE
jgi:hypothetical protein